MKKADIPNAQISSQVHPGWEAKAHGATSLHLGRTPGRDVMAKELVDRKGHRGGNPNITDRPAAILACASMEGKPN